MIKSIAVIGAGQMGSGIAQVAATSGYQVSLIDVIPSQLQKAEAAILNSLERLEKKTQITIELKQQTLTRLRYETSFKDLKVDLVIEAVNENLDLKSQILSAVCQTLPESAIIASNTSSISITQLAAATNRPDRVIGMHFMNPVPLMTLVEVIRGLATSEVTFEAIKDVVNALGKTVVVSQDIPGFIVNRVLMPMINEAAYTLYEGIASVEDIDTAMKLGTNQPMGPLTLADFIGLDTCLAIMRVLHEGLGDTKYRPCPLLVNYVNAGWLGKKTNRGFYTYG